MHQLPCHAQPVQTQVAAASLEQHGAHRRAQRLEDARNVAVEQLVLQRLGGGGNQGAFAAEQGGNEVSIGLAHAGAGFGDQHAAVFDGACHLLRHALLTGAWCDCRHQLPQQAPASEGLRNLLLQAHALSRLIRLKLALQAGDLVTQCQAPLLEATQQQFIDRFVLRGSVNHRIQIRVLNLKLDQAALGGVQVFFHR